MKKQIGIVLFALLLALCAFAYYSFYIPYTKIQAKAMAVMVSAKDLKTAFSANDIDLLSSKLKMFDEKYVELEKEAKTIYWAVTIPYISDFKLGVEAGRYGVEATKAMVASIAPYADLIGFKKGESSFSGKSAEGRLQTAVLTLDKVLKNVDVISDDIHQIEIRLEKIDEKRYPTEIGGKKIRSTIASVKEQFTGVSHLFVDAKPMLKKLPEILGSKKEQTYLLLFQNTAERRATGGFLTAYAVFKIKDGKMTIDKSSDIYTLDASIPSHPSAPPEIATYHKGVSQLYIRDSNLSPDFAKSLELFNSLYKKSSLRVDYDGIIALDSKILVDMLTIFGDANVDGITFSAKIDKRCDCAQVIYQLFSVVDEQVGFVKENRKGVLGDLMYELFNRALRFSPSKYWGSLAQAMFKDMDEKHILLNFVDPAIQQSVEKLNYAGKINESKGDYLHVNNVNFAGAKSNLFTTETIVSKSTKENGTTKREVQVEYRNPYPASNCNLQQERILCLNAPLRNWVRIYVPKGSKLIAFDGSSMKVQTYEDLGKTVFEGFLIVNPMGLAKINVTYTLPASVDASTLMIQKQSGVQGQKYEVSLDGSTVFKGVMEKDTLFK
ncbi:MAG: DUF4012 domain-containing protein [Candidatus Roizmanbacteria bacterium]|nr:DUF4012 domain-containing protein [Candidatus Roizmanbacteria bacterium]